MWLIGSYVIVLFSRLVSRAKFHIVVSAIGIVLDLVLFGYHATSVIKSEGILVPRIGFVITILSNDTRKLQLIGIWQAVIPTLATITS